MLTSDTNSYRMLLQDEEMSSAINSLSLRQIDENVLNKVRESLSATQEGCSKEIVRRTVSKFHELARTSRENDQFAGSRRAAYFLAAADSIRNREVYWQLLHHAYVHGEGFGGAVWKRHFDLRMFADTKKREVINSCYHDKQDAERINRIYDNIDGKRGVIAYRVFYAREGQQIRKSNDKNDSSYHEHAEGFGHSYSLSRVFVNHFSIYAFNDVILDKYCGLTGNELEKYKTKRNENKLFLLNFDEKYRNRKFIGKYLIEKKDIISLAFDRDEDEIIARRSKLISYKTVTFRDFIISNIIFNNVLSVKNRGVSLRTKKFLYQYKEQRILNALRGVFDRLGESEKTEVYRAWYEGWDKNDNSIIWRNSFGKEVLKVLDEIG